MKTITGTISILLVTAVLMVNLPSNALATILQSPLETCGNSALAQTGNSAAEQETEQGQAGDTGAQSVSPEFNALTGNNLGVETQQNGECIPTFEQPPSDSTLPTAVE
jgi:hypothetical protein